MGSCAGKVEAALAGNAGRCRPRGAGAGAGILALSFAPHTERAPGCPAQRHPGRRLRLGRRHPCATLGFTWRSAPLNNLSLLAQGMPPQCIQESTGTGQVLMSDYLHQLSTEDHATSAEGAAGGAVAARRLEPVAAPVC